MPKSIMPKSNTCSKPEVVSVTSMKFRVKTFQRQLNHCSMFLLQSMRMHIGNSIKPKKLDELDETQTRVLIERVRTDSERTVFHGFVHDMERFQSNLADIIEQNVKTLIEFLKLESCTTKTEDGVFVEDPLWQLWNFLLKLSFEQPRLLRKKFDDEEGTLVSVIRNELPTFIATCLHINYQCCTLTEANLMEHDLELAARERDLEVTPASTPMASASAPVAKPLKVPKTDVVQEILQKNVEESQRLHLQF